MADEQQKALSVVLNQLRKKDISGLLAAQRNGTLDEYVRPHLDAYMAKQAEKNATTARPASARLPANPVLSSNATQGTPSQRPVTMARSASAGVGVAASASSAELNPRGITIFRVYSGDIRAELIQTIKTDGLHPKCAYIVIDPLEKEVYYWVGSKCSTSDDALANSTAHDIAQHEIRTTRPCLHLKQITGSAALEFLKDLTDIIFWQLINGATTISVSAELKQKCSTSTSPANLLVGATEYTANGGGQYIPLSDCTVNIDGKELLKRDILKPTKIISVDCGANCYLWIGPQVPAAVVSGGIDTIKRRLKLSPGRSLCQVRISAETVVFTRLFAPDAPAPVSKPVPAVDNDTVSKADTKCETSADPSNVSVAEKTKRFSLKSTSSTTSITDATPVASSQPSDAGKNDASESTVSVADRMKLFSSRGSSTSSILDSKNATSSSSGNAANTATSETADPSTLSVKERMNIFKKGKSIEQAESKKKTPVHIGAEIDFTERRSSLEGTLNPDKIHFHINDGTEQRRPSLTPSFSLEGGMDPSGIDATQPAVNMDNPVVEAQLNPMQAPAASQQDGDDSSAAPAAVTVPAVATTIETKSAENAYPQEEHSVSAAIPTVKEEKLNPMQSSEVVAANKQETSYSVSATNEHASMTAESTAAKTNHKFHGVVIEQAEESSANSSPAITFENKIKKLEDNFIHKDEESQVTERDNKDEMAVVAPDKAMVDNPMDKENKSEDKNNVVVGGSSEAYLMQENNSSSKEITPATTYKEDKDIVSADYHPMEDTSPSASTPADGNGTSSGGSCCTIM